MFMVGPVSLGIMGAQARWRSRILDWRSKLHVHVHVPICTWRSKLRRIVSC